ncbi:MAG: hypothetical protein IPK26_18645 [Planctomycetes bacterium]|nr:hypothetical protein [Planctomycetota bacterium]
MIALPLSLSLSLLSTLPATPPPQDPPSPPPVPTAPGAAGAPASGQPGRQGPPPPLPVPQGLAFARGDRKIEIDGSLVDWPGLPALDLSDKRQLSGTANGAWRGENDLTAFVFLLWDERDLYIACTVKDEWHRSLDANSLMVTEIPAADSVVFTFDTDRNTRAIGPDPGRAEDREFWLADENSHEVVQWDRLRGSARVLTDGRMVVAHDKEHGITSYEARIPWTEILTTGRAALPGLVFDLQVVVNDFDEITDPMPQTRMGWTFGCGAVVDPGLLGSVMLVADQGALQGAFPEFPLKAGTPGEPVPGARYWQDLATRLIAHPPALYVGPDAPETCGGAERLRLLEEIEDHYERFPRVDYLELCHRSHRRMTREVAGLCGRGLPWWWLDETRRLGRALDEAPAANTLRLFRLPQGGWVVRSDRGAFLIDPAVPEPPEWMWAGCEFALLTQPMDLTRRNDQLLVRMNAAKPPRPYLTHIAFHLPLVLMKDMELIEPGKTYGQNGGTQVHALGQKREDGSVPYALGYRIEIADGPALLLAGPSLRASEVPDARVDALLLSVRNPESLAIAKAANTDMVVLDDGFLCQAFPNVPRVTLRDMHQLQRALLPKASIVLAPAESQVIRGRAK